MNMSYLYPGRKWCDTSTDPYRYVIIDLERTCQIKRLLLWDAKSVDADATNMNAFQLFVSTEQPNISLITKDGDNNT